MSAGKKAGRARSILEKIEYALVDKFISMTTSGFSISKSQLMVKMRLLVKKLDLNAEFKNGVPCDDYWLALSQDALIGSSENLRAVQSTGCEG